MSEVVKNSPLVETHSSVVAERLRIAFPGVFSDVNMLRQVVEVVATSMQDLHDEAGSYTDAAPDKDKQEVVVDSSEGSDEENILSFDEVDTAQQPELTFDADAYLQSIFSGGAEN